MAVTRDSLSLAHRAIALLIALAALAPLIKLATLTPSESGRGTHTQLGLSVCQWHESHGYDCPTCGFTTAAVLAARGHIIQSLLTHPAAAVASIGLGVAFWIACYTAVTGSPAALRLNRLLRPATFVAILLLVAASWGYRVLCW
jgi:hypothetical protein